MMHFSSRGPGQGRGGSPHDVVAICNAYTTRLKDKPLPVSLHVSHGNIAEGTIRLGTSTDGAEQLVIKAQGSTLFGLVKRDHVHTVRVAELQRSGGALTASLRRSVRLLSKGDEDVKKGLLKRSLSMIMAREAIDITCENEVDCAELADWIDAKWSVSRIQKSFRSPRIALAMQGRNETLNAKGVYDALEKEDGAMSGARNKVAAAVLPKLDVVTREKLQDDLLGGLHVTYHDLALGGYYSRTSPRILRYDFQSEEGRIYLEPSFEGDGKTISQLLSDLQQVGGGPSVHGPTSSLMRATQAHPVSRAAAVSLVFSTASMDITCGCEKDAREIVLYFSEARGFTQANPKATIVNT